MPRAQNASVSPLNIEIYHVILISIVILVRAVQLNEPSFRLLADHLHDPSLFSDHTPRTANYNVLMPQVSARQARRAHERRRSAVCCPGVHTLI